MTRLSVIAALLGTLVLTSAAEASLQVGTKLKIDTTLPGGAGGQFRVLDPGNPAGKGFDSFVTFCVEVGQIIRNNGLYYVNGIDTVNSTGRALGPQAAYLYTQFRNGAIVANSDNLANGLQYGIWLGMGYTHSEISAVITATTANNYLNQWNANKGTVGSSGWLQSYDTWSGLGSVRVAQLGDTLAGPANRQDQLILVPEATTIAVWSVLSLVGAGIAYRRQVNKLAEI